MLLADPEAWVAQVTDDERDAPLDALPYPAVNTLARYLPHVAASPEGPLRMAVRRALADAPAGASLAVEVGCSVGPDLRALRDVARHVIAFDTYIVSLRAARAQLAGEPIPVLERIEGRSFEFDEPRVLPAVDNVTLVVGDAHDPPVHEGIADVVLSMNVLDNVRDPRLVLERLQALVKPGGLLVVGSPFAWHDAITPYQNQLGGVPGEPEGNTPDMLPRLLTDCDILTHEDVPWVLRDHARTEFHYLVHVVAARRRA